MKKINTHGITNIAPLEGSVEWYFGLDDTNGDLYEAEELFQAGHPIKCSQLKFVHYPDGAVTSMPSQEGQYWGLPLYYDHHIFTLLVDFPANEMKIIRFFENLSQPTLLTTIPLSEIKDCYNLQLQKGPPMLVRQAYDHRLQILWPEKAEFMIGPTESLCFRMGDQLFFSAWYEDPDYRDEIIVRKVDTGEIIDRYPGTLMTMPDGQVWRLY